MSDNIDTIGDTMTAGEHKTGRAQSGNVDLFYRHFGDPGEIPVLIAHGMSYFSYDWIDVAAQLATDREVVVPDQRGFGESTWSPEQDYSVNAFSGDIFNLQDHLGWDRVILMGHSMGGRNVAYCTAEKPERVAALLLVDWSPEVAPKGSKRVRAQNSGMPDEFSTIDEAMEYFGVAADARKDQRALGRYTAFLDPVPGGYVIKRDIIFRDRSRAAISASRSPGLVTDRKRLDMWEVLSRVKPPTLIIRGTASDMFAAETTAKVSGINAAFQIVEVEAGHDVCGDNPVALVREARRFIEEVSKEDR